MRWIFGLAALTFLVLEAIALTGMVQSQPPGETRKFTLYVRDAWLPMPDGSQIYVWGFTDDPNGPAKVPAPPIVVNEGDRVEVTLINDRDPTANSLMPTGEGHTIHLHGLDVPMEHDGVPETYRPGLARQGESYTYKFTATHAGTYFYHCHQNNVEHQQMGMFGPLVVRTAGGAATAYTGGPAFDREETLVLAEMGAEGHEQARRAVQAGGEPYNWLRYVPNYFFINERASPDPSHVSTALEARVGERLLVRVINAGYIAHKVHAHGQLFQIVASDGRAWPAGPSTDTVWLGPGEKYDLLFVAQEGGPILLHDHVDETYTGPMAGTEDLQQMAGQIGSEVRAFTFYVREGWQAMPDGRQIYAYGFTDDPEGPAKIPGPAIVVSEGDTIQLTLINDSDPTGTGHGLRFQGFEADIEGPALVAPGEATTYRFVADRAGSYLYTAAGGFGDQQMGGYGAIVVKAADGTNSAYSGGPSFDQEYTMVLSELDAAGHEQILRALEQGGAAYDWAGYKPNYFLINGLAYPDTAQDPASMVHANPGERVLIRVVNAGAVAHSMHLHGYHFTPVASAGQAWSRAPLKDTILVAPGEAYDLLFLVDQPGLFPFHDHFEIANTNDGVWLGGMHTMVAAGVEHETTASGSGDPAPEGPRVFIRDNFYTPNLQTVPVGTTVVWEHQGRAEHTVTSLLGYFDSGVLRGGDTFHYTFSAPGRYDYFCRFHFTNRGAIIVQ